MKTKGLKLSETLDRVNFVLQILKAVLNTKDKTVFNKVADGVKKAKTVKDVLSGGSPDETL